MSLGMNGAGLATAGAATLLGRGGAWRGATGLAALRAGSRALPAGLFGVSMLAGASSLSRGVAAAGSAAVGSAAASGGAWGVSSGAVAGAPTGGGALVAADRDVAL
jgi:hypothetical protein